MGHFKSFICTGFVAACSLGAHASGELTVPMVLHGTASSDDAEVGAGLEPLTTDTEAVPECGDQPSDEAQAEAPAECALVPPPTLIRTVSLPVIDAKVKAALGEAYRLAERSLRLKANGQCYQGLRRILERSHLALPNTLTAPSAKNAGPQLSKNGFIKLPTLDPREAPIGSVIVYNSTPKWIIKNKRRVLDGKHGHIEMKVKTSRQEAFASDFVCYQPITAYKERRWVIGVYYPTKVFGTIRSR
ncbi:MAG: hypothetical protein JST16_13185 [Bdellovibrionales bacterium]|nr:hypothetical protein [Bdellovibrionales bacterium]